MRYLCVKRREKYQAASSKRLPWIKLLTELLEPTRQPEYAELEDVAKAHLHHIWLLASVFNGRIPEDWLTKSKLNLKSKLSLNSLLDAGFVFWESENDLGSDSSRAGTRALSISPSPLLASKDVGFVREQAFDQIWPLYPRRIGRKEALKHYLASVHSPEDAALASQALTNYAAEVAGREQKFIKHGSAWFRQWQDWIESPTAPTRHVLTEDEIEQQIAAALETIATFEVATIDRRNPSFGVPISDPHHSFNGIDRLELDALISEESGETRWQRWVNFCEKRGMSPVRKTA